MTQTNGREGIGRQVPQGFDLLWGQDTPGGDPSKLLLEFPTHIASWISRGIIDKEDLQYIINEMAMSNAVYRGQTDILQLIWLYVGGTTMVGGKAREQFVDVQKHTNSELAARRGMLGMVGRARSPDGEQR